MVGFICAYLRHLRMTLWYSAFTEHKLTIFVQELHTWNDIVFDEDRHYPYNITMKLDASRNILDLPVIDPRIEHVGLGKLRRMDGPTLKKNAVDKKTLVIREHDVPLAVLVSYEQYLTMQNEFKSLMETLEITSNSVEMQMLMDGFAEAQQGQTRSIEDIRKNLKHTPK